MTDFSFFKSMGNNWVREFQDGSSELPGSVTPKQVQFLT